MTLTFDPMNSYSILIQIWYVMLIGLTSNWNSDYASTVKLTKAVVKDDVNYQTVNWIYCLDYHFWTCSYYLSRNSVDDEHMVKPSSLYQLWTTIVTDKLFATLTISRTHTAYVQCSQASGPGATLVPLLPGVHWKVHLLGSMVRKTVLGFSCKMYTGNPPCK